eukprot:2762732-Pyramimonas_sp.AAC.1
MEHKGGAIRVTGEGAPRDLLHQGDARPAPPAPTAHLTAGLGNWKAALLEGLASISSAGKPASDADPSGGDSSSDDDTGMLKVMAFFASELDAPQCEKASAGEGGFCITSWEPGIPS